MQRLADYVIKRLNDKNINTVFLVTGRGLLYLSDAIARSKDVMSVSTFHEQGAAYAALAYASATGSMGACLVSTGCGSTNALTGLLCAWQDNIPVIFISGQHMLAETIRFTGLPIRTYGSQEADIISLVEPITKYAVMITDPQSIGYELDKAIHLANTKRKGPVWIDIPLDIQDMRIEPENLDRFLPDDEDCMENEFRLLGSEVASGLGESTRPIILVGGGVRGAGAKEELKHFAEKNRIPVVFSQSASDTYGLANELSIGAVGSLGGSRAGNFAIQNADYVLVIGSKLCSQTIGADSSTFARNAHITVVDIDEIEHKKTGLRIDTLVISDAKAFLDELNKYTIRYNGYGWVEKCQHWKELFSVSRESFISKKTVHGRLDLYWFSSNLSNRISNDATVITDAGLEQLIVPSSMRFSANQRCLFPAAQGAMGYAIPAIIGAHYGGSKSIITIVGDGSIMMNIQELLTIAYHGIPAKIFIINNNMYAIIRKRQLDLFRNRTIGNDPSDGVAAPDFRKIADSYGIPYFVIQNEQEYFENIDAILDYSALCICEVLCIEDQKYLHTSYSINKHRKLVRSPLENLSPFIDRELFLSEMIIEPIDQD